MTLQYQRSAEVVSTNVDGEEVLLSIENGKYYGLNSVASRIWQLIEQPKSFDTLCHDLQNEFDVSAEQCETETQALLNDFEKEKVVIITDV